MSAPNPTQRTGRLSTLAAAFVIARRDFVAILWSRSFIFFLLGPLFPLIVGGLAGGVGSEIRHSAERPQLGMVLAGDDIDALLTAQKALAPHLDSLPELVVVRRLKPGESADPAAALHDTGTNGGNLAAILSGSAAHPVLTGPKGRIIDWQGSVSILSARATGHGPDAFPQVALAPTATSTADQATGRLVTAQGAQTLLFLLIMLLAGMVLSNLVEEKGNKIIEVLAAAIPMDAVFLGKLFAMLAVSLVGISVWAATIGGVHLIGGGQTLQSLPTPAVGWPLFVALGIVYFSMGYLLLGSVFLTVGSMASTVREVQTLSMPVTMMQLLVFFFATYAMAHQGTPTEYAAIAFPFSSPFTMLARAAIHGEIWPHLAALGWQVLCVAVFVRGGAHIFRRRVMQSGPQGARGQKRRLWSILRGRQAG
ncbi:ABC transporter permease [Novosphingobium sp. FSY-8]|uniref:ABC transporter permease n=1 Tax=Novosphingobium ovatum TaxID=1908523 RepID=A0ABW9XEW7_9SPHN|nr:ABC transporter permease [Novosphingobium ovatum]NBC37028.1 ABC transporter permease [Novosphingobium ovatum]